MSAPVCVPGEWFGVPLRDGRWAAGRVARVHAGGDALVCYFFGPFTSSPEADDVVQLRPDKAVLVGHCGDVAIRKGAWPRVAVEGTSSEAPWPMPVFQNRDPITGQLRRVVYSDDDLLTPIEFSPSDDPALADAPSDGAMGTGFVEVRLTMLTEALEAR